MFSLPKDKLLHQKVQKSDKEIRIEKILQVVQKTHFT